MIIFETLEEHPFPLEPLIEYLRNTTEDSWCMDVVKTKDGKNCVMGHVWDFGGGEKDGGGGRAWNAFESFWATTYMIYPVNDGTHPLYRQKSAKERCIAYLEDLLSGKEKSTPQLWDEAYEEIKPQKQ